MAYNKAKDEEDYKTRKAVQEIVAEKSKYQSGYDSGDDSAMSKAASSAAKSYQDLTDIGRYDVAKELQGMGYEESRKYLDSLLNDTKSADDMIEEQQAKNMEQQDRNMENAEWQKNWAERMAQEGENARKTQSDYIYDTDPLNTDIGKAILAKYTQLGEDAAGDTYASGSVRNDGNMDSFTSANAARQREEYLQRGIESAWDAYTKRGDLGNDFLTAAGYSTKDIAGIIDDASARGQSVTETGQSLANDITANRNSVRSTDTDNAVKKAAVTGQIPQEFGRSDNIFFNADGELTNPDIDYQSIINEAEARGDSATAQAANEARNYKILNYDKYGQYAPTMRAESSAPTEDARQFNAEIDYSNRSLDAQTAQAESDRQVQLLQLAADLKEAGNEELANQIINLSGVNGVSAAAPAAESGEAQTEAEAEADDGVLVQRPKVMYATSYGARPVITAGSVNGAAGGETNGVASGVTGGVANGVTNGAASGTSGTSAGGTGTAAQSAQTVSPQTAQTAQSAGISQEKMNTIATIRSSTNNSAARNEMYAASGITQADLEAYNNYRFNTLLTN